MKKIWKQLCIFALVFAVAGQTAFVVSADTGNKTDTAETEHGKIKAETVVPDEDDLPDNEDLFAGYVQEQMYGETDNGIALLGNFGSQTFKGLNKEIYDILKQKLSEVASGKYGSTKFEIPLSELNIRTEWTASELGVTSADDIQGAVMKDLEEQGFDPFGLLNCLTADCPYELYWFDKVEGMSSSTGFYSYSLNDDNTIDKIILKGPFTFGFAVADEYKTDGKDIYQTDTNKTSLTGGAVSAAQKIVADSASLSDYDKLKAYKDAVCGLVSYNYGAAADDTTPYGNPWQMIWVFDGDPDTNVVCEGYAKAFQYLCDITSFSGNVVCYTVSGTAYTGEGSQPHMWNIVAMEDGHNYLVDLTNCDSGTIGDPDKLFMTGMSGDPRSGYVSYIGQRFIQYIYDQNTVDLFGDAILTLSDKNYTPSMEEPKPGQEGDFEVSITEGADEITYGDTLTLKADISGNDQNAEYKWFQNGTELTGQNGPVCTVSGLNASEKPYTFTVQAVIDGRSVTSDGWNVAVRKKIIDLTDIIWDTSDSPFFYDGEIKTVALKGNWPEDMVQVNVTGEMGSNPGEYTASAEFSVRKGYEGNYELKGENPVTGEWSIRYPELAGNILYNGSDKDAWYSAPVKISAEGYTVSDSIRGPFTEKYMIGVPDTDGTVSETLYFKNDEGQISRGQQISLNFDVTAPEGQIGMGTKWWKSLFSVVSFDRYKSDSLEVTIKAEDKGSGVSADGIRYFIYNGSDPYRSAQELADAGISWTDYSDSSRPSVQEGADTVVYAELTDEAGNVSYISSEGILADNTAPVIRNLKVTDETLTDAQAGAAFEISESGSYYYAVFPADNPFEPSASWIISAGSGDQVSDMGQEAVGKGTVTVPMAVRNNGAAEFTVTGLKADTEYRLFLAAADEELKDISGEGSGMTCNVSQVVSCGFRTLVSGNSDSPENPSYILTGSERTDGTEQYKEGDEISIVQTDVPSESSGVAETGDISASFAEYTIMLAAAAAGIGVISVSLSRKKKNSR